MKPYKVQNCFSLTSLSKTKRDEGQRRLLCSLKTTCLFFFLAPCKIHLLLIIIDDNLRFGKIALLGLEVTATVSHGCPLKQRAAQERWSRERGSPSGEGK